MLIDGGSTSKKNIAEYTLVPALKYYGTDHLDYVITVSYTHLDVYKRQTMDYMQRQHFLRSIKLFRNCFDKEESTWFETVCNEKVD